MKKYLFETLFYFLLPITVIAVVAEYSIRKIPNDYAYKSQWMQDNSGIDSPAWNLEKSPEWWRATSYSIYYGCKYHPHKMKYNYELYPYNFTTLKKSWDGVLNLASLKNASYLTVNEQGFGTNYSFKKRTASWDNGVEIANLHNEIITHLTQSHGIEKNADYLREICQKSLERNVKVLLTNTPVYQTYRNHIHPHIIAERDYFCKSFAETFQNVYCLNYTDDARFTADDFYDGNHLNEYGAQKLTSILDNVIYRLATDPYFQ